MAKKKLHRTTILLFVFLISSFLFSLSLCSDHARQKTSDDHEHETKQSKAHIHPTIHSAKKLEDKNKEVDDKKERRREKESTKSIPATPTSSSLPSYNKSEASLQTSHKDSIKTQISNNTQQVSDEENKTKQSETALGGGSNSKEDLKFGNQEVLGGTEHKITNGNQEVLGTEGKITNGNQEVLSGTEKNKKPNGNQEVLGTEGKITNGNQEVLGTEDKITNGNQEVLSGTGKNKKTNGNQEVLGTEGKITNGNQEMLSGSTENKKPNGYQEVLGAEDKITNGNQEVLSGAEDKITNGNQEVLGAEDKITNGNQEVLGAEDKITNDNQKMPGNEDEVRTIILPHHVIKEEQHDKEEQQEKEEENNKKEVEQLNTDDPSAGQTSESDPNQSRKNIEEFLRLDIEQELKASRKEGVVNEKVEKKVVEGDILKEDAKSKHDNVQYTSDELKNDETKTMEKERKEEIIDKKENESEENIDGIYIPEIDLTKKEDEKKDEDKMEGKEEKIVKKEEIDPMPSFDEWKQLKLVINEQEKLKIKAHINGHPIPVPRHNTKLSSKNYASVDCGSKIVDSNKESRGTASAILTSNRDEYMLNPCSAKIWFTVEMCEPIQVKRVEIANLELFSSTPESFKVFTSDRYPTSYWREVGLFYARDERSLQTFTVHDETLFTKFIKVEFLTFFGEEHYCPISLLRVFGTSMEEEIDSESDQQIDPSPPEVLPVHPTVSPEDTAAGDGIFDSVIKIVKEAAKAFHAEVRIPVVAEDIRKDELLSCFPYSNGVSKRPFNSPKNAKLKKTDTATKKKIELNKETTLPINQKSSESVENITLQDSIISPSPPIIQHIGCKICQYCFIPHYGDVFHKCHLVKLSISEVGVYFCCYDAPIRTLVYTGAIGLKASTINDGNSSSSVKVNSVNISSKVIDASGISVSTSSLQSVNIQTFNVQPAASSNLESTPAAAITSGIDSSKETPPLPANTSYETTKVDLKVHGVSSMTESDIVKTSKADELKTKDVNLQKEKENNMIKEELKVDVTVTAEASNGKPKIEHQGSPIALQTTESESMTDSHLEEHVDTVKEKKEDQTNVGSVPIKIEPVKESTSAETLKDDVKPPTETAAPSDVKEQPASVATDSVKKTSEAAPDITSNLKVSKEHDNSTKPKPGDGASGNSFGFGIPKESVLMRLNNRIKSLEVNLSLSSLYLQELSQRYKKQMDDMRKTYDTKVAKLYEDAMIAEEKKQIEAEHVKELENEIKKLKTSISNLNYTVENLHNQTFESHFFLMLIEVTIVCCLLVCTRSCRQVKETMPTGLQELSVTTPSKSHGRRNSYSGRINHKSILNLPHDGGKLEGK
ncbi:SUN domain-containing ossification factor-like isoform X2 [Antedon mediterranea]|uniref:SUN domain-containing ossification factor-like isoform X2 n=1 Tax=Antedon mediterranea TaxID=105859 RepID=UPI003AF5A922